MELKHGWGKYYRFEQSAYNRTILELKRRSVENTFVKSETYNRTILELKQPEDILGYEEMELIIAPYWNWNKNSKQRYWCSGFLIIAPYWNWNDKEKIDSELFLMAYNRTILELKPGATKDTIRLRDLIIAPYWNWNTIAQDNDNFFWNTYNRTILELKL